MPIEETVIGGIIGISGGLAVLLVERLFNILDQKREHRTLLKGLLIETTENLRILGRPEALSTLKVTCIII